MKNGHGMSLLVDFHKQTFMLLRVFFLCRKHQTYTDKLKYNSIKKCLLTHRSNYVIILKK
nr:MAG TPA: hypothetical protein [Bacteriophage sp.]